MTDVPQQANAAQLARRHIKEAKSTRGRLGNKSLGSPGLSSFSGGQSITSSSVLSGSGLFGDPSASGAFNFSAPVQGISFGNNSGTSTPTFGTDTEQDRRADTTGEEAARRGKPFQTDNAPAANSTTFNNPFQRTPLSPLGQPNGLTVVPEDGKSNPFQLGRSQSPSAAPVFNFGQVAVTQEHPANNIFSFGQSTQPPLASNTFRFGTPPPAQDKPANNVFSFGRTPLPAQPASTGISFGSTQVTDKPTGSVFSFGQTASQTTQPSSSSGSFHTPASSQPAINIFGQSSASASTPSSNPFGQPNQQPATSDSIFSSAKLQNATPNGIFSKQNQQPATPGKGLFGEQAQKPALATSIFGNNNQQDKPTSNTFPTFNKTPASGNLFGIPREPSTASTTSNIFGAPKPSSNIFNTQPSGEASNIFADKASTPPPSNILGNQSSQLNSSLNLFGNLNQPTPHATNGNNSEAASTITVNTQQQNTTSDSNTIQSLAANGSALFTNLNNSRVPHSPKPTPATLQPSSSGGPINANDIFNQNQNSQSNGFGAPNETVSILPSIEIEGPLVDDNLFPGFQAKKSTQPSTNSLFSSMKPIDAPEDASQPAPSGMFSTLSQSIPAQSTTTNIFAKASIPQSSSFSTKPLSSQTAAQLNGPSTEQHQDVSQLQNYIAEFGEVSDSVIEEHCPPHFNASQRIQYYAAYRVRSLNKGVRMHMDASPIGADFTPSFLHYIARREEILQACETDLTNLRRKLSQTDDQQSSPNKRPKPSEGALREYLPRTSSPLKPMPMMNNDGQARRSSPEKVLSAQPLQPLAMSPTKRSINGSTAPQAPPPSKSLFVSHPIAPLSPSPRGKRKAEVQITKDYPTEEDLEKSQVGKAATYERSTRSETSNVFKSILDKPDQAPTTPGSPEKEMFSLSKTQSSEKPPFNPLASLPMPPVSSFAPSAAAKSSAFSAKNGLTFAIDQSVSKANNNAVSSASFGASAGSIGLGMTASNNFAPEPAFTLTKTSDAEKPSTVASKDGPTALNPFSLNPAVLSTSILAPKPGSAAPLFNPFAPKLSPTNTASADFSNVNGNFMKPPTFGGAPINFLEQFGQKSKKSMAEAEADAMEKAKMEDMDSDDDEAEWEAKYKEKREAEKKLSEELAKSKRATFIPGKGFTFGQADSTSETAQPKPKSIFGQNTSTPASSTSLFVPVNRSGASSPGAASSRGSSVFDGAASGKPVSFGGNNIFGHLSDVDSGADSSKGNDADDDTSDEDTTDSNGEQDDEQKDTTYDPSAEDAPRSGTPVEETGPGIASAKKPTNIFNFGGSTNSGASTPSTTSGSLFDRISKDSNGNPIRQAPGEDKENAGPSVASIFGGNATNIFSFGKKSPGEQTKSPQDNTWKQDSPIKFGGATSPPSVNVTAPTPTKTNSFTGLFGSTVLKSSSPTPTGITSTGLFGNLSTSKPSSPAPTSGSPFAGLFGNTTSAKPTPSLFSHLSNTENKPAAVTFNFGTASTNTSSLLPSSAGSTTTSRATSPGGTTDGESVADTAGDPNAELHEQIDLTSGGPGEENEEILYQLRAKALKFEPSKEESGKTEWVVKGLGPLRVLKNKETGSSRILLRADPSGTIVLNKGVLSNVTYKATGKTLKLLTAGEGGQSLETWLLQVKTPAGAEELAGVLEANKRKD